MRYKHIESMIEKHGFFRTIWIGWLFGISAIFIPFFFIMTIISITLHSDNNVEIIIFSNKISDNVLILILSPLVTIIIAATQGIIVTLLVRFGLKLYFILTKQK